MVMDRCWKLPLAIIFFLCILWYPVISNLVIVILSFVVIIHHGMGSLGHLTFFAVLIHQSIRLSSPAI